MEGLTGYFGQLVSRAFSGLRQGVERAGANSVEALNNLAGGQQKKVPLLRPMADNPPVRQPESTQPTADYSNRLREVFANQLGPRDPARQDVAGYYPILGQENLLRQKEQQFNRPGLADLLALISLYESTGGRASPNIFGVQPRGEGGLGKYFGSIPEAIDYQLSPAVLGGGVGGNLNLLGGQGEITPEEIKGIYGSYDPHGAYIDRLLENYRYVRGG